MWCVVCGVFTVDRWGLVKVTLVLAASIWAGQEVSRRSAAYLEENDIFVPKEDDD